MAEGASYDVAVVGAAYVGVPLALTCVGCGYVENLPVTRDIRIVLMRLPAVLGPRGAY